MTPQLSDVFNVRDCTWVFGGCGGTFYCSVPYMQVLLSSYDRSARYMVVDPDVVEDDNSSRQWPTKSGYDKVAAAYEALHGGTPFAKIALSPDRRVHKTLITDKGLQSPEKGGQPEGPMLLVLNVDNNRARLDARYWCIRRSARWPTAMVVSGCDGEKGQVYWGLWVPQHLYTPDVVGNDPVEIHDWLKRHPDVAEDQAEDARRGGCGGQTLYANALTGQLVGMAIENLDHYCYGTAPIVEFNWTYDAVKGWRMWTTEVTPTSEALAKAQAEGRTL